MCFTYETIFDTVFFIIVGWGYSLAQSWSADNGNGTYTNPIFYDECSDPDIIRVGEDFYLTSTTMHSVPGLPVLHSKDLVNWELLSYVLTEFDLGEEFRLEQGKESYDKEFGLLAFVIMKVSFIFFPISIVTGYKYSHQRIPEVLGHVIL